MFQKYLISCFLYVGILLSGVRAQEALKISHMPYLQGLIEKKCVHSMDYK